MARTVVVTFDGGGLVLGNATARMPGMRVHLLVDRLRKGGLAARLHIDDAGPACGPVVHGLRARYECSVETEGEGDGWWHGRVTFLRPDQLRGHPAYDALLDFAPVMAGGALSFEEGVGYLRLDLEDAGAAEVRRNLAERAASLRYTVQELTHPAPLATWRPTAA